jgi:hypothetical protein
MARIRGARVRLDSLIHVDGIGFCEVADLFAGFTVAKVLPN